MGSTFFNPLKIGGGGIGGLLRGGLDPIGSTVARFSGPNSWFAKESGYDPLISSSVGKFIEPGAHDLGQQYVNRHNPADGNWGAPGMYAGQAPTLQGANQNYVRAAQAAQSGNQVNPYGN